MRVRRLALAAACVAMAAGCGGGASPSAEAPAAAEEYAGRSGGVGASVDFAASDPTTRALRRALGDERVRIGIASMVNDSSSPVPVPRFLALDPRGEPLPLTPARAALRGRSGAAAARALLPPERRTLAARGTGVRYLVLRDSPPAALAVVLMRVGAEDLVDLRPRT